MGVQAIEAYKTHYSQDYECFTVLSQGRVSGLQVLNQQGQWMLAPPIPGTLVVNIGDCLSIWLVFTEE
jgi:isopenicillin N synthase-like dioxygenase